MNEMALLDDLGFALDPDGPPPADLRRRVLTEARRRRGWLRTRTGMRLALAGGLAAAVTGALLALQVIPLGGRPPAAQAQAADVLRAAATQASLQTGLRVRPEQFLVIDSIATVRATNQATLQTSVESVHRTDWLSADGTRDGLIRQQPRPGGPAREIALPGCRDGVMRQTKGGVTGTSTCIPHPAYLVDLPTSAETMLAYLYRNAAETKNPRDQEAFSAAANLLGAGYLPPASLAALFTAIEKIPGVIIVGNVTDEAGRTGIAISLKEVQGTRTDLIFDRASNTYLGSRAVMATDGDGLHAGDVLYSAAVLSVKVADRPGS